MKNGAEKAAIRMMRQYRTRGLSLREIAGNLNQKLFPRNLYDLRHLICR